MAIQRGSTVRMASDVSDADIMGLLQQEQPRDVASMLPAEWSSLNESQKLQWFNENQVTPQELLNAGVDQQTINTMSQRGYTGGAAAAPAPAPAPAPVAPAPFNPVGFDWSKGVQNIGGTIYQPQFESVQLGHGEEGGMYGQGALQNVLRYKEGQTAPGQTYEIIDPATGQVTGTGKFKEQSKGFFGDLFRMAGQAAEDLSPLALAALGVNPGLAAGLGGAAASALGIPVASTAGAAGLTAGQVAALGSGLASTGIGLAQGKNVLDAIKSGLLSGATAMVPGLASELVPSTGNVAVDSALKSAVASGTKAAISGQNVEEAIAGALVSSGLGTATGIDPKVIGNAIKVITSGGDPQQIFNTVVSAAQAGMIPGAGPAQPQVTSLPAYQDPSRQRDTPTMEQLTSAFMQEQGRPPTEGEKVAFLFPAVMGAPGALQALAGILPLAGGALWLASQQKQQQQPPAGMTQQEWLASQQPTRDTTQGSVSPATLAAQGAAALTPSDETARLAARYPAPTAAPSTAPRAPNVDPILQLIQQTSGTPYDVSGDPYAQLPGLVPPDTVAQDVPGVTSPPVDTSVAGKPTDVVDTTVPGTAPSGVDLTVPGRAADQTGLPTTIPFSGAPAGAGTGGGGGEATGGGEVAGEATPSDDAAVEAEVINLLNRLRGATTAPAAAAGSPEPGATGEELPLAAAAASPDAQRLANLLGIDVNTANALIASNPELYGELIGTPTTGFTAPDLEKMSSVDLRNLLASLQEATSGYSGNGNVLTTGTTPPVTPPSIAGVTTTQETATEPSTAPVVTSPVTTTGTTSVTSPTTTDTAPTTDLTKPILDLIADQTQPQPATTTPTTAPADTTVTTTVPTDTTTTQVPAVSPVVPVTDTTVTAPVVTPPTIPVAPTAPVAPTTTTTTDQDVLTTLFPDVFPPPATPPVAPPVAPPADVTVTPVTDVPVVPPTGVVDTTTEPPLPPVPPIDVSVTPEPPSKPPAIITEEPPAVLPSSLSPPPEPPPPQPPLPPVSEPTSPPDQPPTPPTPDQVVTEEPPETPPVPPGVEVPVFPPETIPGETPPEIPPLVEEPPVDRPPVVEPPPPPPEGPPPKPPEVPTYLFDPGTKDKVLTEALTAFSPPIFKGRVGTAYYRPAGEIESEATGKKRRDVWNEASLRLKDALGL